MHPALREVFGERQSPAVIITVLVGGTVATAVLVTLSVDAFTAPAWWRTLLAVIVIWDIACGCLANVTRSTNDYYARRPVHRRIFLAVHVHLVLVALLLGAPALPAVAVWAYTILAAAVVNGLVSSPRQLLVAATFFVVPLIAVPLIFDSDPVMEMVSLLFVTKVILAFAVDHSNTAQLPDGSTPPSQWG